jgi:carbonic anhydrase
MDRRNALKALAGLGLCAACARAGFAADHAIWNYEGASGPEHWGDLDAADKVCSTGSQQSPINVEDLIAAQLSPLKFSWAKQTDAIVNNGHTIQLNFEDGGALKVGRASYKLVQFHFHHPSEHHVDDKDFPMEIHFVHRNNAGGLGVVGVLVKPGKSNPTFAKIIANMPDAEGPAVKAAAGLNPSRLLPRERGYYRYSPR